MKYDPLWRSNDRLPPRDSGERVSEARAYRRSPTMKRPRLQFRLSWLMLAVAIVALLLALLDPVSVMAVVGLAAVFAVPVAMARPERRIKIAAWALALYPVMVPVCLYA